SRSSAGHGSTRVELQVFADVVADLDERAQIGVAEHQEAVRYQGVAPVSAASAEREQVVPDQVIAVEAPDPVMPDDALDLSLTLGPLVDRAHVVLALDVDVEAAPGDGAAPLAEHVEVAG